MVQSDDRLKEVQRQSFLTLLQQSKAWVVRVDMFYITHHAPSVFVVFISRQNLSTELGKIGKFQLFELST